LFQEEEVGRRVKGKGLDTFPNPSINRTVERCPVESAVKDVSKPTGKGSNLSTGINACVQSCARRSQRGRKVPQKDGGEHLFFQCVIGDSQKVCDIGGSERLSACPEKLVEKG
jgi:hypothetical protein